MASMYPIIFIYLSKQFCRAIAIVLAIVSGVFLISNYIDLLTRSVNKDVGFIIITKLSFIKLPYLLHESVSFLIFIAVILAFTRISRTNEYTIIKASGISIWQLLLPYIVVTFIVGVLFITLLNPVSTALMEYNRKISNKYYAEGDSESVLSFLNSGLWFIDKVQSPNHSKRVVHAKYLNVKDAQLLDVSFLSLDKKYNFIERIDAEKVSLKNGNWILEDVTVFKVYKLAYKLDFLELPTLFDRYDLQNGFIDPELIPIWRLGHFISILQNSGYSALQHTAYFYKLLARPFLMCGLVLIAASFALKPMRFISPFKVIFCGLGTGFLLFFFNEFITILGMNGSLPNYFAAISAVIIVNLIGTGLILHLKDG